jgi:hypothetical protein
MVFHFVLEGERKTSCKRLVSRAVPGAKQRSSDVTKCVRLSCGVTDLASEFQCALPKFESLAVPAPVNGE